MSATSSTSDQALTFFEDEYVKAFLSSRPSTPGETIIQIRAAVLSALPKDQFIAVLSSAKSVAAIVKAATKVQRVALVTTAEFDIQLVPLYGVGVEWKPVMDTQLEYWTSYPGFVSSRSGPTSSTATLNKAQADITQFKPPAMDLTCIADDNTCNNLFAKIIRGELEQWRVWESAMHVAFLTPFGNTYGKTVLVPREHLDSDILSLPDEKYSNLVSSVWDATQVIINSNLSADRVGLIFEGMEVNWAHAKLIPICKDDGREPAEQPFTEKYGGSVSSQPGPLANMEDLQSMFARFSSVAA